MNTNLKIALTTHYEPAYRVAQKMGICDVQLSKIVRELFKPRPEEKKALSNILNKSVDELFPEPETAEVSQ